MGWSSPRVMGAGAAGLTTRGWPGPGPGPGRPPGGLPPPGGAGRTGAGSFGTGGTGHLAPGGRPPRRRPRSGRPPPAPVRAGAAGEAGVASALGAASTGAGWAAGAVSPPPSGAAWVWFWTTAGWLRETSTGAAGRENCRGTSSRRASTPHTRHRHRAFTRPARAGGGQEQGGDHQSGGEGDPQHLGKNSGQEVKHPAPLPPRCPGRPSAPPGPPG